MLKSSPDLREDIAATVTVVPDDGAQWSTVSCTVRKPDGSSLATPTVTVSTISTTVGTGTSTSEFTVASAAGISSETYLQITTDGLAHVAQVERVDGTTIYLLDPLPLTPEASDAVVGIEMTFPLTATDTGTRGRGYRAELSTTAGNFEILTFDVVRYPWTAPLSIQEIYSYIQAHFPGDDRLTWPMCSRLRRDLSRSMRRRYLEMSKYADLVVRRELYKDAAEALLAAMLAERFGLTPIGWDPPDYAQWRRDQYEQEFGRVTHSLAEYDAAEDNDVAASRPTTVQVMRGIR